MAVPAYVFRTYSKQSAGRNNGTIFEAVKHIPGRESQPLATDGATLEKALTWKTDQNIPYIFWSSSFLFAMLYALHKNRHNLSPRHPQHSREKEIKIICLCTNTARTCQGEQVTFEYCIDLVQKYQIPSKANHHLNDLACKGCVVPGHGSYILSLDKMIERGLYKLYPDLRKTQNPEAKDFRSNSFDFRKDWFRFRYISPLTEDMVETAARIASKARLPSGRRTICFPRIIFAALLSVQRRLLLDPVLMKWIEKHKIGQFNATGFIGDGRLAPDEMAGLGQLVNLLSCWEGISYYRSGSKKERPGQSNIGSQQTNSQQTDSQQTDSQQTDSQQTDSQQTDSQQADSQQTDPQQTDSQKTDSQEIVLQNTDSQAMSNDDKENKVEDDLETLA